MWPWSPGASRGIGRAIALALAAAGASVTVNYRERREDAEAVVEAIRQDGGQAIAVGADVSVRSAVDGMVDDIQERLGPVDILINNAGTAEVRGLDELTEEDFDCAIAVNLKSFFLCTMAVLPEMRARRWGGGCPHRGGARRNGRGHRAGGPDARGPRVHDGPDDRGERRRVVFLILNQPRAIVRRHEIASSERWKLVAYGTTSEKPHASP
jgi:NAD(P)-dependent dehydrogenase (short-subunit alcohol dehydrogenase family)